MPSTLPSAVKLNNFSHAPTSTASTDTYTLRPSLFSFLFFNLSAYFLQTCYGPPHLSYKLLLLWTLCCAPLTLTVGFPDSLMSLATWHSHFVNHSHCRYRPYYTRVCRFCLTQSLSDYSVHPRRL